MIKTNKIFFLSSFVLAIFTLHCGDLLNFLSSDKDKLQPLINIDQGCDLVTTLCADANQLNLVSVDIDGDEKPDGLDANNDGIAELLFVAPFEPSQGIDYNGDGNPDFFLYINSVSKKMLFTTKADGSGSKVRLLYDTKRNALGFDKNGDGKINIDYETSLYQDIAQDIVPPTLQIRTPPGNTYSNSFEFTFWCVDNIACNTLSYTVGSNPTDPNFDIASTKSIVAGTLVKKILSGGSVTIRLNTLPKGNFYYKI